jgi:hypothetical protein
VKPARTTLDLGTGALPTAAVVVVVIVVVEDAIAP